MENFKYLFQNSHGRAEVNKIFIKLSIVFSCKIKVNNKYVRFIQVSSAKYTEIFPCISKQNTLPWQVMISSYFSYVFQ